MCDIAAVAKLPVNISEHNTDISLNVSSEQTTNSETCTMNIVKHCYVMNRNNTSHVRTFMSAVPTVLKWIISLFPLFLQSLQKTNHKHHFCHNLIY